MTVDPSWDAAVARAAEARVMLVIGETDAGKTSFTTFLASTLLERGLSVGVVDADLGQSDIGPPTTVGLGRLRLPVERLADAEVVGLYFVGSTSPQGHLLPTVLGTRLMAQKALRLGFDRVIVDTSGLVQGELGRVLKQHKIDAVDPDAVLCLQRNGECEPILRPYEAGDRPAIVRLAPSGATRRRSQEERRQHRERSLQTYFAGARTISLDLSRVVLRQPALYVGTPLPTRQVDELAAVLDDMVLWAERRGNELVLVTPDPLKEPQVRQVQKRHEELGLANYSLDDFQGVLAGFDDARRETLGLGVVRSMDFAKQTMVVDTPVPEGDIAAVRLGRHKLRSP
jgi:polynucleotide 5'-hydroxyl-kinase GRC3/NOL9